MERPAGSYVKEYACAELDGSWPASLSPWGAVTGCAVGQGETEPADDSLVVAAAGDGAASPFHGTLVDPPIERRQGLCAIHPPGR